MTTTQRMGVIVLCVGLAGAMILPPLLRVSAPAAGTSRPLKEIQGDLIETDKQYSELMPSPVLMGDADFRKQAGPKLIPVLKKMGALFSEVEVADPETAKELEMHQYGLRLLAYRVVFGDSEARGRLEELSRSKSDDTIAATAYLNLSRWLLATTDPTAQTKILDEMTALAKENARDNDVHLALGYMANMGAANNDLTKQTIEVMRTNLRGKDVEQMLKQLDGQQAQLAMVGKPLDFEGRTSTGGTFKLSAYKGKVVMLDFWATWCGPCIAELPNVKKVYKEYHDKGFEIVGLSCDDSDSVLNDFTKKEDMTWVQLRETSQNEEKNWHPLAEKYGVSGIPTMFLVDRNGVVRYVDARQDLEKKIAELVKESAKP